MNSITITVDQTSHIEYGLSYPLTYVFSLPSGSNGLKAQKKHLQNDPWTFVGEKSSTDFFNGIEAIRFDYPNNKAYASLQFSSLSNQILLEFVDSSNNVVPVNYLEISKYYDNRNAVVTASADDWNDKFNADFVKCCDAFRSAQVWLTAAIITGTSAIGTSQSTWNRISR